MGEQSSDLTHLELESISLARTLLKSSMTFDISLSMSVLKVVIGSDVVEL